MRMMKKRLLTLAIGEFAALCVFLWLYSEIGPGKATLAPFIYLEFILLQGSLYWAARYLALMRRRSTPPCSVQLLRILRAFNGVLIAAVLVSIPFVSSRPADLIWASLIALFALAEYVNYYWYRLSYGKSGFNIKRLLQTELRRSSLSRLTDRQSPAKIKPPPPRTST